ncbi:MAG: flavodoxin-dependent (E)-4-hydroxy-3-methylbut-2-enyl-diphosphate synthase [Peptostreptococcaceae bacterium]|nr:flavodoxin-dependent (E)-4-hydroxy-3-methylbut-2-enyl-diphosphate synthase [Peptostreptococcaceae bacterium]
MERRKTRQVDFGGISIGGSSKITIQSMTNTKTKDVKATVEQVRMLRAAGCDIVRLTVPDMESARALSEILPQVDIPIVADIHFDYRLAIEALRRGVDGLRLNPGNIGGEERVRQVVREAKKRQVKIRIGVNGGSLEKNILQKYGNTPQAMVESAFEHIRILENLDFYNTVVSLKASDVSKTVEAYEMFSEKNDYPLHLGITEAGTHKAGTVKSSVGIGYLLLRGIGDTIRVSLTADPVEEVHVAKEILKSLGYCEDEIRIISCPTCGRTEIDLIALAERIEKSVAHIKKPLTVAIMGCVVNGPGEAKGADIGIAGGRGEALLFRKGEIIRRVKEEELTKVLLEEIEKL